MGRIGGIASMSVIIITLCSPLLGWLIYRRGITTLPAYLLAVGDLRRLGPAGHRLPGHRSPPASG